jgi:hypothetical protein
LSRRSGGPWAGRFRGEDSRQKDFGQKDFGVEGSMQKDLWQEDFGQEDFGQEDLRVEDLRNFMFPIFRLFIGCLEFAVRRIAHGFFMPC